MKPPLCPLTVSAIATIIGLVCYFGYLELERFTGGKFKKLEDHGMLLLVFCEFFPIELSLV